MLLKENTVHKNSVLKIGFLS